MYNTVVICLNLNFIYLVNFYRLDGTPASVYLITKPRFSNHLNSITSASLTTIGKKWPVHIDDPTAPSHERLGVAWLYQAMFNYRGLYCVSRLGNVKIDHALVTALVERWRQETYTFYLPVGEATVTLQNVAIRLGLRIDGRAIHMNGEPPVAS